MMVGGILAVSSGQSFIKLALEICENFKRFFGKTHYQTNHCQNNDDRPKE